MKHLRLLQALASGLALVLITLIVLNADTATAAPSATTRYVLGDGGTNTSDCTNPHSPCKSIQYALDQASHGDTIRVAKGLTPFTYAETISIDKSVTLEGGWGAVGFPGGLLWQRSSPCDASWTTIDAGGAGRAISITGSITPVIDCFTITGGDADGLGGDPDGPNAGGGIYSDGAAPIIINNVITANYGCDFCSTTYGHGGGIYLLDAPATAIISNNLIANNVGANTTLGWGGGIMLRDSQAQILSNTIQDNRGGIAGDGGGIMIVGGSPIIANNTILQNRAATGVMGNGGGIFVRSSTPVTIEHNHLQNNYALDGTADPSLTSKGGGIYYEGYPTGIAIIRDNVILANSATNDETGAGGGMYLIGVVTPSSISGNTVEDNRASWSLEGHGGGIYLNESTATVANNRVFYNTAASGGPTGGLGNGGGIYIKSGGGLVKNNVITQNIGLIAMTGGLSYGGGMVITNSMVTVQDNLIAKNSAATAPGSAGAGGGIYVYEGAPSITGNHILTNSASGGAISSGGGLYLDQTSPHLNGNTILDNHAIGSTWGRGGGMRIAFCPAFTLTNNIIAHNEANDRGSGIAITADSAGTLAHNTVAENATGDGIGVYVNSNSSVALINNIIVSHTVGINVADVGVSAVNATYTLFEANTTNYGPGVSSGNEIAGPAALLSNDHLSVGSNAIDQGATLAWVPDDIDGDLRTYGSAPDVGADEVSCLARVGGINYVTIQAAVDAASPGQTVQVAKGTCYENVSIAKSVTLEGSWDTGFAARDADPAPTSTIDGLSAGRAVSITETSGSIAVTIDGFTITGGDATGLGGAGPYTADIGGGIYSWYADTTVIDCIVTDNVAGTASTVAWGGGIAAYNGHFTLQDSTLVNNVASSGSSGYGGGACFRFGSATLSGNTIEDNLASSVDHGYGGGLWLAQNTVTLQGNTLRNNTASIAHEGRGGGIEVRWGSASLDGDVIEGNRAVVSGTNGYGGAVATRDGALLTMNDVQIYDNSATFGGGIYIEDGDASVISGTLIYSNTGGMGGGVHVTASTDVSLTGNQIYNNTAGYGGGILLNGSADATLEGNYIHDNTSDGLGGGVWIWSCDNVRLTNNIIVENRLTGGSNGAGVHLFLNSTAHFEHTTLARNSGGDGTGLYIVDGSQAWMTNTIVASHTVGAYVDSGCTLILEATLWGDGAWANMTNKDGSGDIKDGEVIVVGDPGFVDPDGVNSDDWDDYHISHTSAAKDAGLNVGVPTDIDGDTRPIGPEVDIGADEAWQALFLPLVMKDF
jgi:fibronectin-binding autotransporter adhesin